MNNYKDYSPLELPDILLRGSAVKVEVERELRRKIEGMDKVVEAVEIYMNPQFNDLVHFSKLKKVIDEWQRLKNKN